MDSATIFHICFTVLFFINGQHGSNYGRVEVEHNNVRGTVCDDEWDQRDAKVVCRQLNLPTEFVFALSDAAFGRGSGPIWMDELACVGDESTIETCAFSTFGEHDCEHGEDAAVLCQGTDLSIFLGGTHGTNFGMLQVVTVSDESVGTICDYNWDDSDAAVACRQLGHPTSFVKAKARSFYGNGTGPVWLYNVTCTGQERNLYSCPRDNLRMINNCTHSQYAGVICGYNLSVQLVDGYRLYSAEGLAQISYNTNWRYLQYNSDLNSQVANVFCRQLGFSTIENQFFQFKIEDGIETYSQIITRLRCDGTEENIGYCEFTVTDTPGWDTLNKSFYYRAYLVCGVSAPNVESCGQLKNMMLYIGAPIGAALFIIIVVLVCLLARRTVSTVLMPPGTLFQLTGPWCANERYQTEPDVDRVIQRGSLKDRLSKIDWKRSRPLPKVPVEPSQKLYENAAFSKGSTATEDRYLCI